MRADSQTAVLNFDAKARRGSYTWDDIAYSYIAGMDSFALGLRLADRLIKDGRIDEFVKNRYASYNEGIGKKISDRTATIEELEAYAKEDGRRYNKHKRQTGIP